MSALTLACSVCGTVKPAAQGAMLVMTLILSLLPLGLIFGVIGFVVMRMRKEMAPPKPALPVVNPAAEGRLT